MPLPAHPTTLCVLAACALSFAGPVGSQTASTKKPAAASKAKPAPAAAPKPLVLPPALAEQLDAAKLTLIGPYDCEFGESLSVAPTPHHEGYVDVHHRKATWTMKPVLSPTGVVRLEDVHGQMLMLQVANKSMVMDVKAGQRVLDGCMHEKQKAYVKPANSESLGIAPAASAAASTPN